MPVNKEKKEKKVPVNRELDLTGYYKITTFPEYASYSVNPEKGTIINKTNKLLSHRNGICVSHCCDLVSSVDNKRRSLRTAEIIWSEVNGAHDKNHFLKHIDGNKKNNSISNLKLQKRGYIRKTPTLELTIIDQDNTAVTGNSIRETARLSGISRYKITKTINPTATVRIRRTPTTPNNTPAPEFDNISVD